MIVVRLWAMVPTQRPDGHFLVSFDPDGDNGMGRIETTPYMHRALRFRSTNEVLALRAKVSTVRPTGPDGQPNRPLTAWHFDCIKINAKSHATH